MGKRKAATIRKVVVVSDLHAGSTWAVCPPDFRTYEGSGYRANAAQEWLYKCWCHWRDWWVPETLGNEPYAVVLNGDMIEGLHHRTKQVVASSVAVHRRIAVELLKPLCARASAVYVVKGTEAHVGIEDEHGIGERLGSCVSKETDEHAAYHWLLNVAGVLSSFKHHIGTSSRLGLHATQLSIHLAEEQTEAARNGYAVPRVIVRGHRHVYGEFRTAGGLLVTCPAWQLQTSFVHKVCPSAKPVVGGLILDYSDLHDGLPRVLAKTYRPDESVAVVL